jgi:hypothetical protein
MKNHLNLATAIEHQKSIKESIQFQMLAVCCRLLLCFNGQALPQAGPMPVAA